MDLHINQKNNEAQKGPVSSCFLVFPTNWYYNFKPVSQMVCENNQTK